MKVEEDVDDGNSTTIPLVSRNFNVLYMYPFLLINLYFIQELEKSSLKPESFLRSHESLQIKHSWYFRDGSQQFRDEDEENSGLRLEFLNEETIEKEVHDEVHDLPFQICLFYHVPKILLA